MNKQQTSLNIVILVLFILQLKFIKCEYYSIKYHESITESKARMMFYQSYNDNISNKKIDYEFNPSKGIYGYANSYIAPSETTMKIPIEYCNMGCK